MERRYTKSMFGKQKPKPTPAPEAKPDSELAADVKGIKTWITNTAEPARKESIRREQINRDGITSVNDRCIDNNSDTRKLWKEKDDEKTARDQEIADLRKANRLLKAELAKKADKPKPAKA